MKIQTTNTNGAHTNTNGAHQQHKHEGTYTPGGRYVSTIHNVAHSQVDIQSNIFVKYAAIHSTWQATWRCSVPC